jgi:hypothetical protein
MEHKDDGDVVIYDVMTETRIALTREDFLAGVPFENGETLPWGDEPPLTPELRRALLAPS